jgi:hypothetical protein
VAQCAEEALRLRSAFAVAWRELPHREALAMTFRYGENLPLAPIADALNVGVPRVTRILQRAERRLADALRATLGRQFGSAGAARGSASTWEQVLGVFLTKLGPPSDQSGWQRKDA